MLPGHAAGEGAVNAWVGTRSDRATRVIAAEPASSNTCVLPTIHQDRLITRWPAPPEPSVDLPGRCTVRSSCVCLEYAALRLRLPRIKRLDLPSSSSRWALPASRMLTPVLSKTNTYAM
jgi:hypothetical protein